MSALHASAPTAHANALVLQTRMPAPHINAPALPTKALILRERGRMGTVLQLGTWAHTCSWARGHSTVLQLGTCAHACWHLGCTRVYSFIIKGAKPYYNVSTQNYLAACWATTFSSCVPVCSTLLFLKSTRRST